MGHNSSTHSGLIFSRRRRSDKDVADNSALTQVFLSTVRGYPQEDLLKITDYYKPDLVYVIEYDITSILQNLVTKQILTNDEAKRSKDKEESEGTEGVESFVNEVITKGGVLLLGLWEAMAEEMVRYPSPNLTRILKEVTEGGANLLKEIEVSLQSPPIRIDLKGLQKTHRDHIFGSTSNLEYQTHPGVPHANAVGLETQYTELMVIKQYTRTYNETHHELEKTGRTHAEMVEERAKEKCEKIWIEQLFRKSPGSKSAPNIVVVSGVAGIGKTTMVQKIMFDWARGTQNKRFTFVFLFKFRDLNLLDDKTEPQMHLTRLIVRYYKYLNDVKLREILQKPEHLLFILDGLDEYKHKLDFTHKKLCSDPEQFFPVHVLITSLIRRTLLKGCSVLITSRPTALESLDMGTVDRFAEILGFFPKQRLMYFKKFFGDEDLGSEAFQYVEENAILYTMCFNPSYCWIICSVLRNYFTMNEEDRKKAPKTVTELFVMFLYNILTNHKRHAEDQRGILVKLGKMAFHGVANRILVFYDKFEMFSFGLKSVDSSPFLSGFLKEILQKENTEECTTYTFFHLTLQEFMAACSFFLDSSDDIEKLLERLDSCADGRFEIFTRFLAGLARYSLTKQLEEILGWFHRKSLMKILQWVKEKAERALGSKDPSELLRVCHWLYETQNKKLIRDAIGKDLKLSLSSIILSPLDCAVLGSVIKCCGELEELRLYKINLTLESMKRLAPGLSCCRNVLMQACDVRLVCCEALSSVLSEETSRVILLRLDSNNICNSGTHLLCDGMRKPTCKLKQLRLLSCELTSESCEALSSAVSSEHSHLTELDLTGNKLGDSGVCLLCKGLRSPKCKLEILGLVSCSLTSGSCEALSLALSSKHSNLIELRLTGNNLEDLGVRLLCEGLRSPLCKLQTMWLVSCGLTRESCEALSSILSSENSHLTELDLTGNKLEDSGTCLLCEGLRSPNCKLKKLGLESCGLTSGSCKALSSALSSGHSHLNELELTGNKLEDPGVRLLCEGLRSPNCKLARLGLKLCGLTSGCCEALWMAICTEHCQLTELNLEHNKLKDLLLHPLREMLTKANCKLKTLRLSASGISDSGKRNLESLEEELSQFGLQIVVNAWE